MPPATSTRDRLCPDEQARCRRDGTRGARGRRAGGRPAQGRRSQSACDELILAELEASAGRPASATPGYMRIRGRTYCEGARGTRLQHPPEPAPCVPRRPSDPDAWDWGVKTSGVTVHFATEDLDMGPIVLQRAVDIAPDDTIESFERKIHLAEYVALSEGGEAVRRRRAPARGTARARSRGRRPTRRGPATLPPGLR